MRLAILSFALGILLLQQFPQVPPVLPWLVVGGFFAAMVWMVGPACRRGRALGLLVCLLFGIAWAAWRAELRLADALPTAWEGKDVEVIGVIAEMPQSFAQGSRFRFAVESVLTPEAVVPDSIMLSWYQGRRDDESFSRPALRPGERWRFTVRLKRPHGNANPHGFDYEAWLFERGIRATGYVRQAPAERLSAMVWRPGLVIERARDAIRDRFHSLLPPDQYPYAGILAALAIGDQQAIQGDLWNVFNRTGTTHLMSISGLHVTMIAALAAGLAGALWRRSTRLMLWRPAPQAAIVAGWLAALLYTLLAGFSVPAQRTLYMLSVAAIALLSGRNPGAGRTLCLALLAVLLLDPWAVLAPGFWLSFCAVGVLLAVGLTQHGRESWRARLAVWGNVQWAATLASLPILLLVFQQFSLVSPLANALAIPVISFIVAPLALLAAVVSWWPLLALAHGVLAGLMAALEWAAQLPVWQAPAPPLWAALAAGVGVAVLLLPRGVPGRGVGLCLLLPALFWPAPRPPAGEAWVDVLDVGQGLAVVVRTAEHVLLYDTGPLYSAESDAGQRVIVPYLRALGISHIDTLIVTHRDADHAGGLASVRAALPVGELLSSAPELGGKPCLAGQQWQWSGVQFAMLYPFAPEVERPKKANHSSCVLRIEAAGRSILLTADIEAPDEKALLERDPDILTADVLLVPHHGSRTSSTAEFLDAVRPTAAIVPVGYRNRFRHPAPAVLEGYESRKIELWRSDRDGAVRLQLRGAGPQLSAWRQERRRYWQP